MRIPSGKIDQSVYFVALSGADLATRLTGLTSFAVYRSRNGGAATIYTTPTVTELSAANMPGVYALLVDEDTTIASTSDSEEYCVHITCATMGPVSRTIELYRQVTKVTLAESYAADGAAPTLEQALFMIQQFQAEKAISGTTMTVKKLDGATPAATFTLDSATAPTSITRAT